MLIAGYEEMLTKEDALYVAGRTLKWLTAKQPASRVEARAGSTSPRDS